METYYKKRENLKIDMAGQPNHSLNKISLSKNISVSEFNKINPNRQKILNYLKKLDKPIRTTDLANTIKIHKKYINRYLNELEKENLIIRKTLKEDKRVKTIELKKEKDILYFAEFGNKYLLLKVSFQKTNGAYSIKNLKSNPINKKLFKELEIELITKSNNENFYLFYSNTLRKLENRHYIVNILTEKELGLLRNETHFTIYYFPDEEEPRYVFNLKKNRDKRLAYFDYAYLRINELLDFERRETNLEELNKEYINTTYYLLSRGYNYIKNLYDGCLNIKRSRLIQRSEKEKLDSEVHFDEMLTEMINQQIDYIGIPEKKVSINQLRYLKILLLRRIHARKNDLKYFIELITKNIEFIRDDCPKELLKQEFNEKNLDNFLRKKLVSIEVI